MKYDCYHLEADDPFTTFYFISEGPKGRIEKVIQFSSFGESLFYNLAMGDIDPITGEIGDFVVTNNGDAEKVLVTIVAAVYEFCKRFSGAWVYATGSTPARTRLYQMGINKYYDIANHDFNLYGETVNGLEPYVKDRSYSAFVVQLKSINSEYEKHDSKK